MRLLVTGGAGFFGAHVVRAWLDADARHGVTVLDLVAPDAEVLDVTGRSRIDWRRGDVAAEWPSLPRSDITHVVHAAAVTSIRAEVAAKGFGAALPALATNILGTARALAVAGRMPRLRRLLYVSSAAVYPDDGPDPMPEDAPGEAPGLYPLMKRTSERLVAAAGLPAVSVRLAGLFGPLDRVTPHRQVEALPKRLVAAAATGRTVRLGGLDGGGDWLAAEDAAAAVMALLQAETLNHPVYNVARGRFTTLRELADAVPGLTWTEGSPADIAADPGAVSGRNGACDIARLTADTRWRPAPLRDGLAAYSRNARWK